MATMTETMPVATESQVVELEQLRARSTTEPIDAVNVEDEAPKWNYPRGNLYRTLAAFWSLFTMGANDAAYGVSLRLPILSDT